MCCQRASEVEGHVIDASLIDCMIVLSGYSYM
jgi:hypothetical protein